MIIFTGGVYAALVTSRFVDPLARALGVVATQVANSLLAEDRQRDLPFRPGEFGGYPVVA